MRLFICLASLCVLGCGSSGPGAPTLYPVTGSLKVEGKPLEGIIVQLMPTDEKSNAKPGVGKTDKDGNFKILSNGDKGAAAGNYKVVLNSGVVTSPQPVQGSGEAALKAQVEQATKMQADWAKTKGPPVVKNPFPKEWADAATTPKTFEVKKESNTLTLDI